MIDYKFTGINYGAVKATHHDALSLLDATRPENWYSCTCTESASRSRQVPLALVVLLFL